MQEEISMNKMGTQPVKKLMLSMGIPIVISMMLQALYNIVDSYFVANMKDMPGVTGAGEYAMNALTLAFPVQMLMVAMGVGTGVGINALLAKSLGEGNRKKASRIAGNAIFLGICTYAAFLVFALFGVPAFLKTQTSDPIVLEMGSTYLRICCGISFGIILFTVYEKLLQATGRTLQSMISQIAGAVTNIILDPILIFGLFGFPELGVAGAAYATVAGQILSLFLGALFHYKGNRDLETALAYMKPSGAIIKEIYQVGIPAILMQALMSFMTYGVNIIFGAISANVVTAYGIYYKIQQFVFFAAFGLNNALIPIVSFNYGMQDKKRIHQGIRYGLLDILVIMALGMVILQVFAGPLISIFALSEETGKLCIRAIRIITAGFLFAGANIAYQGIFQALGCGVRSLVISLLRQLVIVLPVAYLFTRLPGAQELVWLAFPIAEGIALLVALIYMRKIRREKIDMIKS